jgi:two-component system, NtrC family, sensor kinase
MATKAVRTRERSAELKSYNVLIVDDQPETLASLRRLLREEAYQLVTCDTPAKALEWVSENRVDLFIADERMPDMRGSDLLERVREISPETVRVILTGYPGSSTVAHGLSHGVDWLISKPWNDDALKITIRQLLEERDRRKRPRPASATPAAPRSREADTADFCEQAAMPLCSIGGDGAILWANRAELELLGYTRDEYVGRSFREFHADPRTAEEFFRRLYNGETLRQFEARLRCRDGTSRDVLIDANVQWEDRRFVRARCVTRDNSAHKASEATLRRDRDELETEIRERTRALQGASDELIREIAERKRAEDTQRLSEMRFRLLVEGVKDYAILMLSPDGVVVSWNVGAERIQGYTAEEILGRSFTIFYPAEDIAAGKPEQVLRAAAEEGRVVEEGWRLRKNGSKFWCNVAITALRDAGGRLLGYAKVTRDLTEHRLAEEERNRLSAQMLQGQKLQAIGQLSAGIAHEINNPVGYILSNLNTLGEYCQDLRRLLRAAAAAAEAQEQGKDPSDALEEFRRIAEDVDSEHLIADLGDVVSDCKLGGEKIRDIVRSLREFSHVDEGALRPTDLNKCLDDALRICWNELKYKADVRKEYAPDLPLVPAYPQRLGQVFINLLVNAGQAIEKRGQVLLSTCVEEGFAVVRVRDTGRGIPPENLSKLFEPFFTTKDVGTGTGLGLHTAYKIVTAHRGKIDIHSDVGQGTEFTVRIPLDGPRGGKSV